VYQYIVQEMLKRDTNIDLDGDNFAWKIRGNEVLENCAVRTSRLSERFYGFEKY
jgi:hypothetical protein